MFEIPANLNVPPYHSEIIAYLQREQPELWRWFASNRLLEAQADAVRLELLKSAYRVDGQSTPRLHGLAHEAAQRLGLDVPMTLYHSQRSGGSTSIGPIRLMTAELLHRRCFTGSSVAAAESWLKRQRSAGLLATESLDERRVYIRLTATAVKYTNQVTTYCYDSLV